MTLLSDGYTKLKKIDYENKEGTIYKPGLFGYRYNEQGY